MVFLVAKKAAVWYNVVMNRQNVPLPGQRDSTMGGTMDIFVIHSGGDRDTVMEKLTALKKEKKNLNFLLLESGSNPKKDEMRETALQDELAPRPPMVQKIMEKLWWLEASRKIQRAQLVVFYVGQNSHTSPYIGWEIKTAIRCKKPIYTIKLEEGFEDKHPALQVADRFSRRISRYDTLLADDAQLLSVLNRHQNGDYDMFNGPLESLDKALLLEQYKVFLQTSEDLVARRQTVNNFYISINSALVALFSAMFAFELSATHRLVIGLLFSAVGIVLSVSWIRLLASYGNLNSSKMRIISSVERHLPASLYDAEWAALSDKLNKKRYISFTESEKNIPRLFIVLYTAVFALLLVSYFRS